MIIRPPIAFAVLLWAATAAAEPLPGGTLDPTSIPKFETPLVVPPAMPRSAVISQQGGKTTDYYEIAVRQFEQQILPPGLPATTVWSYGSLAAPGTVAQGGSFHYPAFTIEAKWQRPVRVKWVNDLVDASGHYLPHLLPVDQTLHWANPPGECAGMDPAMPRPDCTGTSQLPYTGPVPMIVHVHGAESTQESDGYPEAWFLPAANDIPAFVRFTTGSFYERFKALSPLGSQWQPGTAVFEYANEQRATTLWYHDHALGMTRLNVYAGPAGFYLLRGGPDDVLGALPGPGPALGDPPGLRYFEIPIAIQDRSFDADGSLFYPAGRAFFEGLEPSQLQIPFKPDPAIGGPSDVSPIWNPEFFGNTIVVNGRTWPYLEVEKRRYRFRLLNGSQSRFLILRLSDGGTFWQIGADGGFLPQPTPLSELLLGPAERADTIVDFSRAPVGAEIELLNVGPDEPFSGSEPGEEFEPADAETTGRVMQFRVVHRKGPDRSTRPERLVLPARAPLPEEDHVRRLALVEEESETVFVSEDESGALVFDPDGEPFGPTAALLGTIADDGTVTPRLWADAITENPGVGDTEIWEIHNFTADAHPIHIHLVQFEVVGRELMDSGAVSGPEPWEAGTKDTVIAYPDQVTRVRARFDREGLFVWHCHILEHEDNEMMRPYCVGGCAP